MHLNHFLKWRLWNSAGYKSKPLSTVRNMMKLYLSFWLWSSSRSVSYFWVPYKKHSKFFMNKSFFQWEKGRFFWKWDLFYPSSNDVIVAGTIIATSKFHFLGITDQKKKTFTVSRNFSARCVIVRCKTFFNVYRLWLKLSRVFSEKLSCMRSIH